MKKEEENSFWSRGSFIQPISKEEIGSKMRTFHMKHDEEMNFKCKKCGKKISAHNNDWHGGMCDKCFNEMYFPEI